MGENCHFLKTAHLSLSWNRWKHSICLDKECRSPSCRQISLWFVTFSDEPIISHRPDIKATNQPTRCLFGAWLETSLGKKAHPALTTVLSTPPFHCPNPDFLPLSPLSACPIAGLVAVRVQTTCLVVINKALNSSWSWTRRSKQATLKYLPCSYEDKVILNSREVKLSCGGQIYFDNSRP